MRFLSIAGVVAASALLFSACSILDPAPCGYYEGHRVHTEVTGACYYINSSGMRIYVSSSYCDC